MSHTDRMRALLNKIDNKILNESTSQSLDESAPHFMERKGGLILWQLDHYHYVITTGTQPYEVVRACPDCSAEEAEAILDDLGSGQLDEGWQDELLAMAQKTNPNARMRGSREEEMARTRDKLERNRAAASAPRKIEKLSPEQIDQLKAELAKLKSGFDANYAYSDDHSVFSRNEPIAQQIKSIERTLRDQGEQLDELSKETLGSYVKRASRDAGELHAMKDTFAAAGRKAGADSMRTAMNRRHQGIDRATDRLMREDQQDNMQALQNIVDQHQGTKLKFDDGTALMVDVQTANAILTVYSSVNPDNQAKLNRMVNKDRASFGRVAEFCWSKTMNEDLKRAGGIAKATDRLMREDQQDNMQALQNIVDQHQGTKLKFDDGTALMVDVQTANAILTVYSSVNPDNQAKLNRMINKDRASFGRVAEFCWSKTMNEDQLTESFESTISDLIQVINESGKC